jgi:hypothetical protein
LFQNCRIFAGQTFHGRREETFELVFASQTYDCGNERKRKTVLAEKRAAEFISEESQDRFKNV